MKNPEVYQSKSVTIAHPTHGGELNQNKVSFQHEKHHVPALPPQSHNALPEPTHLHHGSASSGEIAVRAHAIFIEKGAHHGHDLEHWLRAESELVAERKRSRESFAKV